MHLQATFVLTFISDLKTVHSLPTVQLEKIWFDLKPFLGNESTVCPLVLKQGKASCPILQPGAFCHRCDFKLESPWCLSLL